MEVPRLGVTSDRQLHAYATATAMWVFNMDSWLVGRLHMFVFMVRMCIELECYQLGFLAFLNQEQLIRCQKRKSGRLYSGHLLQQRGAEAITSFPCSPAH